MARHGGSAGTLRVLHVDDDPAFTRMTAEFLQRADDRFEVLTEPDPRVALERLTEDVDAVDCVLSDYQMPAMDGLELLREVRTRLPDGALPFVLLTGRGSEEVAADALNAGGRATSRRGVPTPTSTSPDAFARTSSTSARRRTAPGSLRSSRRSTTRCTSSTTRAGSRT
jgi:CheY-like chemotaxis protein